MEAAANKTLIGDNFLTRWAGGAFTRKSEMRGSISGFPARCSFPKVGVEEWNSLQRLYSNFANAGPGKGLFILRLAISSFLISDGRTALLERPQSGNGLHSTLAAGAGVFLCLGLWTPIAGAITAILELYLVLCRPENIWPMLLAAGIAAGLALLGPGSWSVDAHVYGRKRISLQDR